MKESSDEIVSLSVDVSYPLNSIAVTDPANTVACVSLPSGFRVVGKLQLVLPCHLI